MKGMFSKIMNRITPIFAPVIAEEHPPAVPESRMSLFVSEPTSVDTPEGIIEVDDRFLIIPFPSPDKQDSLADYLAERFGSNYLVFNVSEHTYDPKPFANQVVDYTFPGHPCLPLEAAFTLCKEMDSWLQSDPKHVIVVHCQSTKAPPLVLSIN